MTTTSIGVAVPLDTVIVPTRLLAERFSLATKVNEPLAPVPEALASASQDESLDADHVQVAPPVVTSICTGPDVPDASTVVLPGTAAWANTDAQEIEAASCVISICTGLAEPEITVIVAERLLVEELSLAEYENEPLAPVPEAPLRVSHD